MDVLERMGHEVTGIAVPPVLQVTKEQADKVNKPIPEDVDLVLVSGPEHLRKWIKTFYGGLKAVKAPKVAWFHESFVREDYTLNIADYEQYDFHFFPDKEDARKYKGDWLPLGVDTAMFNTGTLDDEILPFTKDIGVAFIGLMYPKRARFVQELMPHLGDIKIDFRYGCNSDRGIVPAIAVYDFEGMNIRKSMQLLAETYRRIKVFVTFPSLSNVLVAKVLESMACGCRLVAPKQPVELEGYFPYTGAYECASQIRKALTEERDGAKFVREHHRMELRFERIFEKVGLACPTSS